MKTPKMSLNQILAVAAGVAVAVFAINRFSEKGLSGFGVK